jgi:tetratricopeptide (TPR) repeat protein
MKKISTLTGNSIPQLLMASEDAWHRKDFQGCLDILQRANRLAPGNIKIMLQLGRFHGLRYDYETAEKYFEQALRLTPRKAETLVQIADNCQFFRKLEISERFLQRAVELPDTPVQSFAMLAELHERFRRLAEAGEIVERALKIHPGAPTLLLIRSRLERLTGNLDAAEATMRSFITKPLPSISLHSQCWYELGTNLDRQGRYDEAMAAFVNAKNPLRPQQGPLLSQLKLLHDRFKIIESSVSRESFQRWFGAMPDLTPPRPLAFLCGHARSGTTLLEQVLDAHPDIISEEETDIFFDEVFAPLKRAAPPEATMVPILEATNIPTLQRLRSTYFDIMERSLGEKINGRILVDKNPGRTFWIPALVRVFPEIKLLVALRDPRDIVMSGFMLAHPHPLNPATASLLTLEGAAHHYVDSMSIWRTFRTMLEGHYLEIRYEDMVADLEPVARKTLDFLGATWDDRVLGFDEHARHKVVRSPTYADVTQKVYKRARGRWRNYQKYLEPCLPILEPLVKAFGYG